VNRVLIYSGIFVQIKSIGERSNILSPIHDALCKYWANELTAVISNVVLFCLIISDEVVELLAIIILKQADVETIGKKLKCFVDGDAEATITDNATIAVIDASGYFDESFSEDGVEHTTTTAPYITRFLSECRNIVEHTEFNEAIFVLSVDVVRILDASNFTHLDVRKLIYHNLQLPFVVGVFAHSY
jgi:hypothetical protein